MYRPDNWDAEEIVRQALGIRRYNPFASEIRIAEAGADAMLAEIVKEFSVCSGDCDKLTTLNYILTKGAKHD